MKIGFPITALLSLILSSAACLPATQPQSDSGWNYSPGPIPAIVPISLAPNTLISTDDASDDYPSKVFGIYRIGTECSTESVVHGRKIIVHVQWEMMEDADDGQDDLVDFGTTSHEIWCGGDDRVILGPEGWTGGLSPRTCLIQAQITSTYSSAGTVTFPYSKLISDGISVNR